MGFCHYLGPGAARWATFQGGRFWRSGGRVADPERPGQAPGRPSFLPPVGWNRSRSLWSGCRSSSERRSRTPVQDAQRQPEMDIHKSSPPSFIRRSWENSRESSALKQNSRMFKLSSRICGIHHVGIGPRNANVWGSNQLRG